VLVAATTCETTPIVHLTRITVYTTVLTGSGPPVPVPVTRIVPVWHSGPADARCDGSSR
jgi:hypothetical protein